MKEKFKEVRFRSESYLLIDQITGILAHYEAQGYDLSLRQLYYQLVSMNIVENTEKSYKRVGSIVSDGRLAGLIDWDMIKDRGRSTEELAHWSSPNEILAQAAKQYRVDLWETQPIHVEVMVEKQALEGVLLPACRSLDVPFTANKGYSSSSSLYEIGKRLLIKTSRKTACHGKPLAVILYLGDHDPSGLDMTRDVEERLLQFSDLLSHKLRVVRIALNMDQVREFEPPENPAKLTDSRASAYVKAYGRSSWELDALPPSILAGLVTANVKALIDAKAWQAALKKQEKGRKFLKSLADDKK